MNFVIFPQVDRHHRERKKGLLIGPLSIDTKLFLSLTHFFFSCYGAEKTARFLLESVLSSLFPEVRRKYRVLLLFYSDSFLYCIRLQLQIPNSPQTHSTKLLRTLYVQPARINTYLTVHTGLYLRHFVGQSWSRRMLVAMLETSSFRISDVFCFLGRFNCTTHDWFGIPILEKKWSCGIEQQMVTEEEFNHQHKLSLSLSLWITTSFPTAFLCILYCYSLCRTCVSRSVQTDRETFWRLYQ